MNITGKTSVYGIFGNPVTHSFSPVIQNTAFASKKIDAAYVAFEVKDLKKAVSAVISMNIKGLSITIPFKIEIIPLLDEVDELARNIGAVNTVLSQSGRLIGYNTDGIGALKAVLEAEKTVKNKKICMIGCGGAARAIGFTLAMEKPSEIQILVRKEDVEAGKTFSAEIQAKTGVVSNCFLIDSAVAEYDILINTTPVGMHPMESQCPVKSSFLIPGKTVFDIIYNPKETLLIQEAKKKKCNIVYGFKMLLNQGLEQFRIWTGQNPPEKEMAKALIKCLK